MIRRSAILRQRQARRELVRAAADDDVATVVARVRARVDEHGKALGRGGGRLKEEQGGDHGANGLAPETLGPLLAPEPKLVPAVTPANPLSTRNGPMSCTGLVR